MQYPQYSVDINGETQRAVITVQESALELPVSFAVPFSVLYGIVGTLLVQSSGANRNRSAITPVQLGVGEKK